MFEYGVYSYGGAIGTVGTTMVKVLRKNVLELHGIKRMILIIV